jgi:hypothetical protein
MKPMRRSSAFACELHARPPPRLPHELKRCAIQSVAHQAHRQVENAQGSSAGSRHRWSSVQLNVRFGSKADMTLPLLNDFLGERQMDSHRNNRKAGNQDLSRRNILGTTESSRQQQFIPRRPGRRNNHMPIRGLRSARWQAAKYPCRFYCPLLSHRRQSAWTAWSINLLKRRRN